MSNKYSCLLITPQGKIFDDQVESVLAPGSEGLFEVLASHTPFISTLKKGVLKIVHNAQARLFDIGSGILEVGPTGKVLILADSASPHA